MTTLLKALVQSKFAEAAETIQYTSKDCTTTLDKMTATNVTVLNAVISVSLVKSGESAGTPNRITFNKSIAPGVSYNFQEISGHVLEAGDFVSCLAGTASALVIKISGRQFT